MRTLRALVVVTLSVALAGCTLGGDADESRRTLERADYTEGLGVALRVNNTASDAFEVAIRVLGVGNEEVAALDATLPPEGSHETWAPLGMGGTFSARVSYTWNNAERTAHGTDEQVFSTDECADLTRLTWELRQGEDIVGIAFLGSDCASADDA